MNILKTLSLGVAVAALAATSAFAGNNYPHPNSGGSKLVIVIGVSSFAKAEKGGGEHHGGGFPTVQAFPSFPGGGGQEEKSIAFGDAGAFISASGDTGFSTGGGYSASASTGGTSSHGGGGMASIGGPGGPGGGSKSTSASASGGFGASGCTGSGC